jgi:hypothetical protein
MNYLKILFIVIILPLLLTSCFRSSKLVKSDLIYDSSAIAILHFDKFRPGFFKDAKPAELTTTDINKIEELLTKSIIKYNSTQKNKTDLIELKQYKRQYWPMINHKGEKEVFIDCFLDPDSSCKNWQKSMVIFCDGGNAYFILRINLTTETYSEITINGEA